VERSVKDNRNTRGYSAHVYIYLIAVAVIFILAIGIQSFTGSEVDNGEASQLYSVAAVKIPEKLTFAGEKVPLDNFDTRESLDRELLVNTYFHSQTFLLIKRSARFFPLIEPMLKKYGIPDDFKYLSVIESGLENSVSPRQAVGFWQLVEGTAKEYGMEINDEVDERYHIEKSTEAACKYFLESYQKYKSWTMAAASYNAGRNGIDRQIGRQNGDNYYDLLLNEETSRYIFRALSIKMIGINYKILKYFNPWLRETYLTNRHKKEYYIKIPKEGCRSYSLLTGKEPVEIQ
jgi:membrane-bound lytic murein transglycosylase D